MHNENSELDADTLTISAEPSLEALAQAAQLSNVFRGASGSLAAMSFALFGDSELDRL